MKVLREKLADWGRWGCSKASKEKRPSRRHIPLYIRRCCSSLTSRFRRGPPELGISTAPSEGEEGGGVEEDRESF